MAVAAPVPLGIRQRVARAGVPHQARQAHGPFRRGLHHLRRAVHHRRGLCSSSSSSSAETLPLFRSASRLRARRRDLAAVPAPRVGVRRRAPGKPLAIGIDEYQMYFYELLADGRTGLLQGRRVASPSEFALERVAGPPSTAASASRSLTDDFVAVGTDDGRVLAAAGPLPPRYEDQKLVDLDLERARPRASSRSTRRTADPGDAPTTRRMAARPSSALVADDEILL